MTSFKAIIFDLDDTIVNTSQIKHLRRHPWNECYSRIPSNTFSLLNQNIFSLFEDKKILIGIVTNSPRPYATRVLSHHNFKYADLICYHDCTKRKPNPDPMILCATRLGVDPQEIISIGDHSNDILASKSAGMTTIGVTWGESTKEELALAGSDYIVGDIDDLVNLLNTL